MKKPFYSKHNRKFCVFRTLVNAPKLTKADYLKDIFSKLGLALTVIDDILDNCLAEVNDKGFLFSGGVC